MATTPVKKTAAKTASTAGKKVPAKKAVAKTVPATKKLTAPVKELGAALEAPIWSSAGTAAGTVSLPAELFGVKWNADLVHQVVVGMQANARPTTAHTKFRGEVSGGGKKPWKQKGTGRARHGSSRSPIWKGGGVTHGPRAEKNYSVKINRKMRIAALLCVLSQKLRDGEVLFVEKMVFAAPSTKEARAAVVALAAASQSATLSTKRVNAALIAISGKDMNLEKSFQNMGNVALEEMRNLNPVDVLNRRYLIIENPTESIGILAARLAKKA